MLYSFATIAPLETDDFMRAAELCDDCTERVASVDVEGVLLCSTCNKRHRCPLCSEYVADFENAIGEHTLYDCSGLSGHDGFHGRDL